jgi:putative flippase GtrA
MSKEFIRFAIVGVIATAIHYGLYYLLNRWINVNVAYTIGYVVSLCCNFFLTAYFTFRSEANAKRGAGFLFSHGVNYLIHMGLLNLFLWIGLPENIAPVPVFAIAIPVNFLLVRTVFKNKHFQSHHESLSEI